LVSTIENLTPLLATRGCPPRSAATPTGRWSIAVPSLSSPTKTLWGSLPRSKTPNVYYRRWLKHIWCRKTVLLPHSL